MLISAIDILREVVNETDLKLRDKFEKYIHFESGYTSTIVNSLTQLMEGPDPYPIIAVFTEGLKESYSKNNTVLEFTAPKITIAIRTIDGLTETQRLETSFKNVLYPIFVELCNQLRKVNFSYELQINKYDIPYYTESNSRANTFNDMLDGIVIKDLKMKVLLNNC